MQTVVCIHSSAGSPRQWGTLREQLAGRYEVVAPALHGAANGPIGRWLVRAPIEADVEIVAEAVRAAHGPVHLVGHSYGGVVALHLAQRMPAQVRSVAVHEPVLFSQLREHIEDAPLLGEIDAIATVVKQCVARGDLVEAARAFVSYWGGDAEWRALSHMQRLSIAQRMPSVDANFDSVLGDDGSAVDCDTLPVPVLLLRGTTSPRPALQIAHRLFYRLPNVLARAMSGAGHMAPITHARRFAVLVSRFLDCIENPQPRELEIESARGDGGRRHALALRRAA